MSKRIRNEANVKPLDRVGASSLKAAMMLLALISGIAFAIGNMVRPVLIPQGSYEGIVLDEATGKPISGAVVFLDWRTHRHYTPFELSFWAPESSDIRHISETVAVTDNEGRYRAPEDRVLRWVHWLTGTPSLQVLIYKPAYIAFRNDGRFDGHQSSLTYARKKSFPKKGVVVRMTPWRDDYEHWKHLQFISDDLSIVDPDIYRRLHDLWSWENDLSVVEHRNMRAARNDKATKRP